MKKLLIVFTISIFFVNFATVNAQTEIIIDYELNANDEVLTNFREKRLMHHKRMKIQVL